MRKAVPESDVKIRRARNSDAGLLAVLCGELGYPCTTKEMQKRLHRVLGQPHGMVLVAEKGGEVIGWVHSAVCDLLETPRRAEINGLIVGESQRSGGAGAKLLEAAEHWARKKKCLHVSVRSNVIRVRAHKFYERQGYEHFKTQKAFRKPL